MIKVVERCKLATGLAVIDIGHRAHPAKQSTIKRLAVDMELFGLRYPIRVRRVTSSTFKVVCGASRLQAARLLGWTDIDAEIVSGLPNEFKIDELNDDLWNKRFSIKERYAVMEQILNLREPYARPGDSSDMPPLRADASSRLAVRRYPPGKKATGGAGESVESGLPRSTD